MRIGHGYDAHRLVQNRKLILGGVDIHYDKGLLGHSDADVLTHAVCDALLGAAALGDVGRHFPDTDETFRGISSLKLLARVKEMIDAQGYCVGNIDATVIAEKPRLMEHIPAMVDNLSSTLKIDATRINIKATTTEGMGFTGTGQGIAAWATVLILKRSDYEKDMAKD
jgi:2-C-methyl-D-erythritol 2,4-cyclodiphosphate synthase